MNMIITGAECKDCIHYAKASTVKIKCLARDREYYYGQCIPCEDKEKFDERKNKN